MVELWVGELWVGVWSGIGLRNECFFSLEVSRLGHGLELPTGNSFPTVGLWFRAVLVALLFTWVTDTSESGTYLGVPRFPRLSLLLCLLCFPKLEHLGNPHLENRIMSWYLSSQFCYLWLKMREKCKNYLFLNWKRNVRGHHPCHC